MTVGRIASLKNMQLFTTTWEALLLVLVAFAAHSQHRIVTYVVKIASMTKPIESRILPILSISVQTLSGGRPAPHGLSPRLRVS